MGKNTRTSPERIAIDQDVVLGSWWCNGCGRAKPIKMFYWRKGRLRPEHYCLLCRRIKRREYNTTRSKESTERRRAHAREYWRRPEVVERYNKYKNSAIGKLTRQRTTCRRRIKQKPTERLIATEKMLTKEIERLRALENPGDE